MAGSYALLAAPSALAGDAYVTNYGSSSISLINTQTDQVVGSPIAICPGPRAVAITPDGSRAFIACGDSKSVDVLDTRTNQVVGTPIEVGKNPSGIAITPSGRYAYVANRESNNVSVIDTQTDQVVGSPIKVGSEPMAIAIAPDGGTAYVVDFGANSVTVIDTQTNQVLGSPITVGSAPIAIAITPDGATLYVCNVDGESVSVIDTQSKVALGAPIAVGEGPYAIAISPGGNRAYVGDYDTNDVSVIDTATNQALGAPISLAPGTNPGAVAIVPNGRKVYVVGSGLGTVSVLDAQTDQLTGAPLTIGGSPSGIAIPPDQPPTASFSASLRARPEVPLTLDASASHDPDGTIASYTWAFGDGQTGSGGPTTSHAFAQPGPYQATLTVNDGEGCPGFLFTGQTADCNGASTASQTQTVTVAYPGVRVKCPKSARPKGCKFKLHVVTKKRKGKAESAVAKARANAGHSTVVSLKPRQAFAAKLAIAMTVLVKETATTSGRKRTFVKKLKIVQ